MRHLGALADGSDSFSQNTEQAHIRALVVLPDGRLVSSENPFRNRTRHIIKVWNLETQACLLTLPDERRDEGVLAVLGDGRLAIGTNKTVELWNLKTKNKLLTLRGHTEDVASLVDLGDDRLASGSRDNAVKIWNTITGNCEKTLLGHGSGDRNDMGYVTNGVKALVVLPDGRLASGSVDKTIKLWDVARGVCVMTLSGHEKHVTALAVLADGRLASGSEDKTIKLWDITTGKCVTTHTGHTYGVRFLAVLEDGRLVSGSGDHTIRLWGSPKPGMRMAKVPAATPVAVSAAVTAPISTATHAAPAPAMAGAGAGAAQPAATSGIVIAFERAETAPPKVVPPSSALTFALPQPVVTPSAVTEPRQTSKKVITLSGHSNSIYALVVLPDGRLISCSGDQFIKIWDPASGACLATLTGHTKTVSALVLLPDGRLASASWDDSIKIWDIASGTCVLTMTGQSKGFHALAVLADGRLVSGSGNNLIEIWDTASGTCRSSWKGHSGCVIGLVALSDGRLASGSHDESIKIWDVASGTCQMTLTGHSAFLIALTILSDGRLVSSSNDLSIKIWDPRSKDCLFTLTGHSVGVTALTALPNGHLISGDDHGVIKIWDTDARVCLATWDGSPCVRAFTLLHDGRLVSGSGINPYIQIWNRPVLVVTGPAPQLTALTPSAPGRIPAVVGAGDGAVVTAESKASPVAQPIPFNEAAFLRFSERLMQIEDHALTAAPAASVSEALLQNEAARIARLEFEYIVAKPLLQDYYHTLQASLYDTFLAAFTIHSGMVANQKVSDMQSYVSMGVSVIDYFCQSIPIASHISSAASAVLNQAISIDQSNKVNRLLALLLDHTKAAELANRIARNLSLAFEDEIVTLVKTEHPLIRWLKAQRDKLIFNDINTPQKAEAAVHAMQLIKLAMQAKLKRAQLETDEFIVLIKPGYDLQTLQDKRTELYAVPPVVSTPASLPLSPAAVSVIASPSTAGACLSPVTGTNTTPVSPPAPGVSPAELAELRAAHETEVAALRKEISKLASRMSTQQRGHEQDAAGAGLAYADPLGDESSRVTLVKLQEKMSHLAQRDPQIEAMLSELQEMSETINPARAAAEFNNKTFAFAEAVRVIKHVADQCYGADGHRLRLESSSGMISIAAELQGPAVREPKHVRGEAIMNVLSRYHLATFVSMSQLTNMLTHDEPAGYYHSAHVVTGAELVQDAVNRHALLTSPG